MRNPIFTIKDQTHWKLGRFRIAKCLNYDRNSYNHVSYFERKINSQWLNENKIRSKCFMFTHICPSFVNVLASKYRTSKGTLHQNYTRKHQNYFLKVNMRSFAIISNFTCQSTIVSLNHGRLGEFQPTLFRKSKTHYLHNVNPVSTCR